MWFNHPSPFFIISHKQVNPLNQHQLALKIHHAAGEAVDLSTILTSRKSLIIADESASQQLGIPSPAPNSSGTPLPCAPTTKGAARRTCVIMIDHQGYYRAWWGWPKNGQWWFISWLDVKWSVGFLTMADDGWSKIARWYNNLMGFKMVNDAWWIIIL